MRAVNVRKLKHNPSGALHKTERKRLVVTNRDHSSAALVHQNDSGLLDAQEVKKDVETLEAWLASP